MKHRTKLCDRQLPDYTIAEERLNTLSHAAGALFGIAALALCTLRAAAQENTWGIAGCAVYGVCMTALYAMSGVYHGIRPGTAKKVLQVLDHCTIYFLIAGTYTPILLVAIRPVYPVVAWGLFCFEWALAAVAVTLTAVDLKKYSVFSMVCYIGMGWAVIPFAGAVFGTLGNGGFFLLLFGGLSYTIGAVLYGLGKKRRWMHGIFHLFTLLGTVLQFFAVYRYVL